MPSDHPPAQDRNDAPDRPASSAAAEAPAGGLILPMGTRVVSRTDLAPALHRASVPAGTVGVIVRSPSDATHAYRVRFPDGGEGSYRRDEIVVLSEWKALGLTAG